MTKSYIFFALFGYGLMAAIYLYDRWQSKTYFDQLNTEFPVLTTDEGVNAMVVDEKSFSPAYRRSSNTAMLVLDDGKKFFVKVGLGINTGQEFIDITKNSMLFIKKPGNDTIELRHTWEAKGYIFVLD